MSALDEFRDFAVSVRKDIELRDVYLDDASGAFQIDDELRRLGVRRGLHLGRVKELADAAAAEAPVAEADVRKLQEEIVAALSLRTFEGASKFQTALDAVEERLSDAQEDG